MNMQVEKLMLLLDLNYTTPKGKHILAS